VSSVTWLALVAVVALAVVAASRASHGASASHAERAKVVASAVPDRYLVEARR
jgi:hypothetical protein